MRVCGQRCASYERQVEQLRLQLTDALQGATTGNSSLQSHTPEATPDMQHAIDILKRSSLEVELAAKEGEVRYSCLFVADDDTLCHH